jgi:hypothetical protein
MNKLIRSDDFFCKWLYSRLMRLNKNVLGAEVGATGSGKSYRDLRKVEVWYKNYLHRPFPVENICFGVGVAMKRLSSGELSRGDVLIFEEAGANLGALDFQNRVSKMFTYVLQSFRSMNIGIFFNLPYLSMLNKTARMLLHYSSESLGIDFEKRLNYCKFFFHQVNQRTGKIYPKYPRALFNGSVKTLKKFAYEMPSVELAEAYERIKKKYLSELTTEYFDDLQKLEATKIAKMERKNLTDLQSQVYELYKRGNNQTQIGKILGISQQAVCKHFKFIKKKYYNLDNNRKFLENNPNNLTMPVSVAF